MSFLLSPSPRSSFFEERREVVNIEDLDRLKAENPDIMIAATEGQTFSNEGVEIIVEPNKVLIVYEESGKMKGERSF